ncbi:MAG: hypothetical protein MI864_03875 [Pseudomonadales bacterium]|nr:hypothetical protein [Pseudomonadales bacterium]
MVLLLMVAFSGVAEQLKLPQAAVVIGVGVLLGPAGFSLVRWQNVSTFQNESCQ